MRKNEILEQKRRKFRELYPKNPNLEKLCYQIGVGTSIIRRWKIEDFGEESPEEKKRRKFRELYAQRKFTIEELAEKLEVSSTTLHKWRRQYFEVYGNWRYLKFKELIESGEILTAEDAAARLEICRTSILRYLRIYLDEDGGRNLTEGERTRIFGFNLPSTFRYLIRQRRKLGKIAENQTGKTVKA